MIRKCTDRKQHRWKADSNRKECCFTRAGTPVAQELQKNIRNPISRILFSRCRDACYLSVFYIAAKLELITPRHWTGRP